ncbi:hypothetical protein TSOC_004273 [Tetrabaena socialis]|uniref:Uncharacterized protein n=1 Tax=Tetrabaena socialis TaxID=47790 RepID=A0A2J8A9H2_9CHLO|nr:hypothetical protein TSOC_004273 [Tetrabaena socialis]|eukprot:PNH09133.1 hypothetical protein TSOC_004273 [Tetrabaena socialis]
MNAVLLRTLNPPRSSSLTAFSEYRENELGGQGSSVTATGVLLEYETLELRVHPPNVRNVQSSSRTIPRAARHRLRQLLLGMMDPAGDSVVNVTTTKGLIHYERRLHQLLLQEEEAQWVRHSNLVAHPDSSAHGGGPSATSSPGGPTSSLASAPNGAARAPGHEAAPASASSSPPTAARPPTSSLAAPLSPPPMPAAPPSAAHKPEVLVRHFKQHNYWTVSIRCRDRQKLLFDTVWTLADLNYDVYHGAVDCEVERERAGAPVSVAVQTFYMRPRFGDSHWDPKCAAKLQYMLECAIQRRQPQGTKVHIQALGEPGGGPGGGGSGNNSDLPALTAVWRDFGLCISRAKVVRSSGRSSTFYLVDRNGRPPADTVVQAACQQIGGVRLARADGTAVGMVGSGGSTGSGGVVSGSAAAAAARTTAARNGYKFGFTVFTRPGWAGPVGEKDSQDGSVAGSV